MKQKHMSRTHFTFLHIFILRNSLTLQQVHYKVRFMQIKDFKNLYNKGNIQEYQKSVNYIVYLICNAEDDIVYIGSTQDIDNRIKQHSCRKKFRNKKVFFFLANSEKEMVLTERRLIRNIKPQYNIRLDGEPKIKSTKITIVGKTLLELMKINGLDKRSMAKKMGCRKERISQIIIAERIQLSTLKQILKAINTTISGFYINYPEIKQLVMGYKR